MNPNQYINMLSFRILMVIILGVASVFVFVPNARSNSAEAVPVSMIALLSNPEDFDGKVIEIEGFLTTGRERNALYCTQDAAKYGMGSYSIRLNLPKEFAGSKFSRFAACRVAGKFSRGKGRNWEWHRGDLEVSSISVLDDVETRLRDDLVKELGAVEFQLREDDSAKAIPSRSDLEKQREAVLKLLKNIK